ncbi:hypothetical protein [Pedobacter cryoconitis]|uniref:Lipoprotein n=1 Tax=Pedobacter cryoconitis TaxID=188932 RepID=A0A327TC52_9SPHI|nr:hypothetical protein [Pedobacter cryoconitis]RAJ37213.1 hypothetical protein LY11_00289 [Pedobacter cryoconitis]
MRLLLMLFALIVFISSGCKQTTDSFTFDSVIGLAYSNLTTINQIDTTEKVEKEKAFKPVKAKKGCRKVDSCDNKVNCYLRVM